MQLDEGDETKAALLLDEPTQESNTSKNMDIPIEQLVPEMVQPSAGSVTISNKSDNAETQEGCASIEQLDIANPPEPQEVNPPMEVSSSTISTQAKVTKKVAHKEVGKEPAPPESTSACTIMRVQLAPVSVTGTAQSNTVTAALDLGLSENEDWEEQPFFAPLISLKRIDRIKWITPETPQEIEDNTQKLEGDMAKCGKCSLTGKLRGIRLHVKQHYLRSYCACNPVFPANTCSNTRKISSQRTHITAYMWWKKSCTESFATPPNGKIHPLFLLATLQK